MGMVVGRRAARRDDPEVITRPAGRYDKSVPGARRGCAAPGTAAPNFPHPIPFAAWSARSHRGAARGPIGPMDGRCQQDWGTQKGRFWTANGAMA